MEKTVTIQLPKTRERKEDVYVGVNGISYLIKRGVPVEVPEAVAEVLTHSEQMQEAAMAYEDEAQGRYAAMGKVFQ